MTGDRVTGDPAARTPGKGAGLRLSREMKLVLAIFLLLSLLGAWFVWTGNRAADELAQLETPQTDPAQAVPVEGAQAEAAQTEATQPGAAATPPAESSSAPETGTDEAASAGGTPVEVAPGGQVEVPVIPAFGTLEDPDAEGAQAEAIPAPGGINPDTALAALPSVNPFRPLALEGDGQTAEAQSAAATVAPPAAPVAQAPAISPPPAAPGSDRSSTSGGPLALSPLPGTATSTPAPSTRPSTGPEPVAVTSPRVTGGAFPTPTLPGANVPAPVAVKPSPSKPSTARPSTVRVTRPAAVRPAPQPTTPARVRALPAPTPVRVPAAPAALPAPARPPVAGVQVPPTGSALNGTLAPAPGQAGGQPGAATPEAAASANGAAATALPTPGTPQPITQLGADGDGVETGATGPLGTLVQTRELAFDAVVLGPVNTAILRSRDGFVVVSQGQTLPDSDVVVREISAEKVTLELGPETQTLDLDRPNSTQGEP